MIAPKVSLLYRLYSRTRCFSVTNWIDPILIWCHSCDGFGSKREVSMIKKAKGGYKVLSEKGKNLGGPYKSKKEAEKRLKQVEYFKHIKKG